MLKVVSHTPIEVETLEFLVGGNGTAGGAMERARGYVVGAPKAADCSRLILSAEWEAQVGRLLDKFASQQTAALANSMAAVRNPRR